MAGASYVQTRFTGGEWSKFAQGLMDDPDYHIACNVMRNNYPLEEGCVVRRPGFRHTAKTYRGRPGVLRGFNFDQQAPYNMEFTYKPSTTTNGRLRFHSGNQLVFDPAQFTVTDISTANPAVVTFSAAPGWSNAVTSIQVQFLALDKVTKRALPLLANRQFLLTPLTSTTFSLLTDDETDTNVDGATLGWSSSHLLVARRVLLIATPYVTADTVKSLRVVQSDKVALLLQGAVAPQALSVVTSPTATSPATFSLDPANFIDGPYLDPYPGSVATPSAVNGIIDLSLSAQAYSSAKAYNKNDIVTSVSITYQSLSDANVGNTPASSPTFWKVVSPGIAVGPNGFSTSDIGRMVRMFSGAGGGTRWTWGKITALSTTGAIDGNLSGVVHIGDMASNGGLAAAFDGNTSKLAAACAMITFPNNRSPVFGYIGQNYNGATGGAKTVSSAVVYPSSDKWWQIGSSAGTVTVKLYGSNTAPANHGDGTLLGTTVGTQPFNTIGGGPITVFSTDTTSTWKYVWVEIRLDITGGGGNGEIYVASVQFFSASGVAGTGVKVQVLGDDLATTDPMATWRLGAYSDTTGWPTCGCYHEGRFWLAGAIKNRWDASKSNSLQGQFNFAPTAADGTISDQNAITYVFNSSDVNSIFWMIPDLQGIVCGTQGGEWLIQSGSANTAISPTNVQAHRITKYGCANIEPRRTGLTTVFVQKFKRRLLEYLADAFSGKFFGPNLSEKAKHLSATGIEEIAYQEELAPIIWCRMGDGSLAGLTYRRVKMFSSEQPKLLGWHRHDLGSGRTLESICVGPSVDGLLDTLAAITIDPTDPLDYRHVEVKTTIFDEDNDLTDAFQLDNAVVPSAGTKTTVVNIAGIRFDGLWHLNTKRVDAWIAGLDCGTYVVTNGSIFVPFQSDPDKLFTYAYCQQVTAAQNQGADYGELACDIDDGMLTIPAVIGFTFTSQGQLLRPFTREESGARNGPAFAKLRRIHRYNALLHKTQGMSFGRSFDDLQPCGFQTEGKKPLKKNELFSGVFESTMPDRRGPDFDGMLCWQVDRPYPCTMLALGGNIQTTDQ